MFANELNKLLIEHLGDLDDGARRLEMLQQEVAEEIDDIFDKWVTEKGWIKGDETWKDDRDASVARPPWFTEEKGWIAWFQLDFASGDDGNPGAEKDHFWLTRLCREGRGQMGFRFVENEFGKTQWKRFLKANANRLADTRFILDDEPSLFLPFKIEKDALANGAEHEDFSEALQPLTEALDHLYDMSTRFEELRQEMLAQQGS